MLQNIRDNVQGIFAKVIMGLLLVPFALFGIESLVGNNGPAEVARINGEKIREPELVEAINVQKRQLLARMGENIQPELLEDAALRKSALDDLITRHLLKQSAERMKLRLPVGAVDRNILAMADFQEDGKFSPTRYEQLLRGQGYTPNYFKQLIQEGLLINQLYSGFIGSEFATPAEFKNVAGMLQQQRSFRFATLPIAGLADKIAVGDDEAKAYYAEHTKDFMSEERVRLEYIELRAQDYFKTVDDTAVKSEYERESAAFKPRTERHAAHIMIEVGKQRDDAQAQALLASIAEKLKAGDDFAKLAAQYSDDVGSKANGGDLGVSTGDTFPEQFEATLAKLSVGEVSGPVKSESGYHLIKLVDQQTSAKPTFEQRKADIAQSLQESGAQPELTKNVEKLRDLVFNSDGLGGPAKEVQATIRNSDWIDRKSVDPLLGNPKVIAAAFSQEVLGNHNNSEVLELSPDHFVVLRVKEHTESAPKPFDEVKPAIVAAVKQRRATEQLAAEAQQLIKQVRDGGDFAKLASQQGYTVKSVEKSMRNNGSFNAELLRMAFALPKTEQHPIDSLQFGNGDIAVLQLEEISEGTADSLAPAQRDALVAQFGKAGFAAFMEDVREKAEITRR
jgi:peptidyl-prolyl cis-trans isomerase D